MGIWNQKANNTVGGEDFERPDAGSHRAVCVALIDLGTHTESYQGKSDEYRKVFLVWELVDAPMAGIKRNHTMGKDMRLSMSIKANLRKMLESWRGMAFREGEDFNIEDILGKACMLNVVHSTNKDGSKTYANVDGVSRLIVPKGQAGPKPTLPLVKYEVGVGAIPAQDWLPRIYGTPVKDYIEDCHELRHRKAAAPSGNGQQGSQQPEQEPEQEPADIPF